MLTGDRVVFVGQKLLLRRVRRAVFWFLGPLSWCLWLWPSLVTGLGHTSIHFASLMQDLENQMHIAEQRRRTLLKDFHDT